MYEIRSDVPIPEQRMITQRDFTKSRYRLHELKVGDSVLVTDRPRVAVNQAINRYQLRFGKKFTAKTFATGIRIWRTK